MINLHNVVRGAINSINPDQSVILKINTGTIHKPGGIQEPSFDEITAIAQVQPVKSSEIQFIANYQSGAKYKNFYFNGNVNGINRRKLTGGDIIIWNGFEWYVDAEEEDWDTVGWTKVRAIQQLPVQNGEP